MGGLPFHKNTGRVLASLLWFRALSVDEAAVFDEFDLIGGKTGSTAGELSSQAEVGPGGGPEVDSFVSYPHHRSL